MGLRKRECACLFLDLIFFFLFRFVDHRNIPILSWDNVLHDDLGTKYKLTWFQNTSKRTVQWLCTDPVDFCCCRWFSLSCECVLGASLIFDTVLFLGNLNRNKHGTLTFHEIEYSDCPIRRTRRIRHSDSATLNVFNNWWNACFVFADIIAK